MGRERFEPLRMFPFLLSIPVERNWKIGWSTIRKEIYDDTLIGSLEGTPAAVRP